MKWTQEQLNQVKKVLGVSAYNEFMKIQNGYNSTEDFEQFKGELNKKAINYMNDELYDDRQTKIMISRAVEELTPVHMEKIEKKVTDLNETKAALENYLHKENATWHKVVEFEEKKMGAVDVTQLKTDALLASNPNELIKSFRDYLNSTTENEALAKILYRNAHVFLERMGQLDANGKQQRELRNLVHVAKRNGMTEVETLSRDMLAELSKNNITGTAGRRLIQNYGQSMIKNHEDTLHHEEAKKDNPSEVSIAGNPNGIRGAIM